MRYVRSVLEESAAFLRGVERSRHLVGLVLALAYISIQLGFFWGRKVSFDPLNAQRIMQSLDLEWIRKDFWGCLLYNHYQPPLFSNFILGGLYVLFGKGMLPAYYAANYAASLAAFAAFLWVLNRIGTSQKIILAASLTFILYPAQWYWTYRVLYTAPSLFLMTGALFFFTRFAFERRLRDFALLGLLVAALTWIYSIFHFTWGLGILVLAWVLAGGPASSARKKAAAAAWAALAVLLLAVPVKNGLLFGNWGSSTCLGIVLGQKTQVPRGVLARHARRGEIGPALASGVYHPSAYLRHMGEVPEKFRGVPCLVRPWKSRGSPQKPHQAFNYNLYATIPTMREMARDSFWLIRRYPRRFFIGMGRQFVEFFSGSGGPLDPTLPVGKFSFRGKGLSWRGIFYLAGLWGALGYLAFRAGTWRDPRTAVAAFAAANALYGCFVGIVIGIRDGPRYRLPFELCFVLLAAWTLQRLAEAAPALFRKLRKPT
jgi:hypothetical protein